jgi:Arc/MetJ-type ribon-helix-helix transcriptional regulator
MPLPSIVRKLLQDRFTNGTRVQAERDAAAAEVAGRPKAAQDAAIATARQQYEAANTARIGPVVPQPAFPDEEEAK